MKTFNLWARRILKSIVLITFFLSTISHSAANFVFWDDGKPPAGAKEGDLGIVTYEGSRDGFQQIEKYHFGRLKKNNNGELICAIRNLSIFKKQPVYFTPIASLSMTPEIIEILWHKTGGSNPEISGYDLVMMEEFQTPATGDQAGAPPDYLYSNLVYDQQFMADADKFKFKVFLNSDNEKTLMVTLSGLRYFTIYPENRWLREARKESAEVFKTHGIYLYYHGCGWVRKYGETVKYTNLTNGKGQRPFFQLADAMEHLCRTHAFKGEDGQLLRFVAIDGSTFAAGHQADMRDRGSRRSPNRVYRIITEEEWMDDL